MLERATACLDSGARISATCAKRAPRSRRLLHSQFWNHGAGDLDLPPFAVSMKAPPQWTVQRANNDHHISHDKPRGATQILPAADAPFLDFLYPPHALAWLRRSSTQSMERWENRNARRLPEGFIQASRGYASKSHVSSPDITEVDEGEEEAQMRQDTLGAPRTRRGRQRQAQASARKRKSKEAVRTDQEWLLNELELLRISGKGGDQRARQLAKQLEASEEVNNAAESKFAVSAGDLAELPQHAERPTQKAGEIGAFPAKGTSPLPDPNPDVNTASESAAHVLPSRGRRHRAKVLTTPAQKLRRLRILLQYRDLPREKRRYRDRPRHKRAILMEAWRLYDGLPQEMKDDALTIQMVLLYSTVRHPSAIAEADKTLRALFKSISLKHRTPASYQARLETIVRKNSSNGFAEALILLKDSLSEPSLGAEVAGRYFLFFLRRAEFHRAMVVWHRTSEWSSGAVDMIESDIVAAIAATPLTLDFAKFLLLRYQAPFFHRARRQPLLRFCNRIYWQALRNAFIGQKYVGGSQSIGLLVRRILRHVQKCDPTWLSKTEAIMEVPLAPSQHQTLTSAKVIIPMAYQAHLDFFTRSAARQRPSERFLSQALEKAMIFAVNAEKRTSARIGLSTDEVISDWKRFYRTLPVAAVSRLMSFYAQQGDVRAVRFWQRYLRRVHQSRRADLFALEKVIYVYAQRGELDDANRAFEEAVSRLAESGDEPKHSAWNIMIHAHARADDLEGALQLLHRMSSTSSHRPDEYSFGPVLLLLAERGDVHGVQNLLDQYDEVSRAPRNTFMMTSLLAAYVNSGNLDAVEPLLRQILQDVRAGKVRGQMTDCFNLVLNAYAVKRDVNSTMAAFRWMEAEGIPQNGKTFSGLMQALTSYRQTNAAKKILTHVMPSRDLRPDSAHYAIVISGFNKQEMYEAALEMGEHMRQRNVRPSAGTDAALRRAEMSLRYRRSDRAANTRSRRAPLDSPLKQAADASATSGSAKTASQAKPMSGGLGQRDEATAIAAKYDFAIALHGKRRMFKAVLETFESYKAELKRRGIEAPTPPLRMLTALMSAYLHAGEYEQVEECWQMAKNLADEITRPATVPKLSPSQEDAFTEFAKVPDTGQISRDIGRRRVVVSRSYILSRPLRCVIEARAAKQQLGSVIRLVSQLLIEGYTLDNLTWNAFIQQLCHGEAPLALLAYVLTERFLISSWPGWKDKPLLSDPLKRSEVTQGLQYMRARYLPPDKLMPQYKTMVRLAQTLLVVRRTQSAGNEKEGEGSGAAPEAGLEAYMGTLKQIRERAPRTLKAVQTMPRIEGDYWQQHYIRREV